MHPQKYRNLLAVTELKKSFYSSGNDFNLPSNNTVDQMKKTSSQLYNTYQSKNVPDPSISSESKYKKYNEISGINNNYNLPNDNKFDSNNIKDYNKYDFKYNKGNDNLSAVHQTTNKLNSSLENKNTEKFDSSSVDKYSQNSYNMSLSKEPKFMAITDDYKLENSLEVDKNTLKKYDNLGNDKYGGYKNKLDKIYDNKYSDIADPLNDKESYYDKEFSSFNNNKVKNYNYNDELNTPKDSNFNNVLKYETNSQKHSPLRNNNNEKTKYDSKYDYLGSEKDTLASNKSTKDRYFSSEKRVFRNGEKEKERVDKFESSD